MQLPISILLTRRGEHSQLWFARDALRYVTEADRLCAEPTERGLLLHGATEFDLERAFTSLESQFPGLRASSPHVNFIEGSPRLEPYYSAVVTVPEVTMGEVMGDLSARRGLIVSMEDAPSGRKRIKADVPVIECFGYSTHLRAQTGGQGAYEFIFIGYRPFHGHSTPPTDVA